MSALFELHERPELESPIMIVVLEGWIDAGVGAQLALERIQEQTDTVTLATFDTDRLLDHRARRPTMELTDGVHTGLHWPSIELRAASNRAEEEFLLLTGVEPDHQWRAFSRAAVDLALELGARLVVGLGAYPAPVPHTRPTGLASTATSRELADQIGYVQGTISVPAGVQAAIEARCRTLGIPAIGLWAQVPHYAAAMPYPGAAVSLLEGLGRVGRLTLEPGDLADQDGETRRRLDQLVAESEEHQQLVAQLEAQVDAMAEAQENLPTGEELAEELERFLREKGDGPA